MPNSTTQKEKKYQERGDNEMFFDTGANGTTARMILLGFRHQVLWNPGVSYTLRERTLRLWPQHEDLNALYKTANSAFFSYCKNKKSVSYL